MVRVWLRGVGFLVAMGVAGCGESASSSGSGSVQIVASDDGTVEVIAAGKVLFALAPTGPVARNFSERAVGVGTISFERSGEVTDPLSVERVSYVGPARNVSIVFSVLLGALLLKERHGRMRLLGSILIVAGILVTALLGNA